MKNILKYLRRTKDLFLIFGRGSKLQVERYTDVDFMSDPDDRKSTSRYVFTSMMVQLVGRVSSNPS